MGENNLSNTSTMEYYKCEEVKIDIDKVDNLSNTLIEQYKRGELNIGRNERLKPDSQCCIYRVPKNLREIKEKPYTPQFISIGPFHHRKHELANMEKQKIRYKEDFGGRFSINEEGWGVLITYIKNNEQRIRDHYDCDAETSIIPSNEFIIMILYDAIFIFELLLKYSQEEEDFLIKNSRLLSGVKFDLQLIENQLPSFVLKELYDLANRSSTRETRSFFTLSCRFFFERDTQDLFEAADEERFKHFVDLRRILLVKNLPERKAGKIGDLPSAVKLNESGVKFKNIDSKYLLDIKFRKTCTWIPLLRVNELLIPHITIYDETECLFRNIMAFEQCHYPDETHVCNYVDLIDYLINTEKDVDLLVDEGIITNCLGDHAAVAEMFNNLCVQITPSKPSCYEDIIKDLINHRGKWGNRTKATLIRVYFSNLWRGTGTVAAFALLVLTLLQTIYSMRG